ncbi:MAG: PAS domain-containing protein [Methylococcales bacterium]|jgi:PAS domain-containing protein|nr:PAS domain-containing protein [Methylococcales bacterium]MBT7410526.1 PAS domain-containing protein [Methylococcales bacterium]
MINDHFLSSLYPNLLQQWHEPVIILDNNGIVQFINVDAATILGWEVDAFTNQSFHELVCIDTDDYQHDFEDCPYHHQLENQVEKDICWLDQDGSFLSISFKKRH